MIDIHIKLLGRLRLRHLFFFRETNFQLHKPSSSGKNTLIQDSTYKNGGVVAEDVFVTPLFKAFFSYDLIAL